MELMDYNTNEELGEATDEQVQASREAAKMDGGAGVILIDSVGQVLEVSDQGAEYARRCYVQDDQPAPKQDTATARPWEIVHGDEGQIFIFSNGCEVAELYAVNADCIEDVEADANLFVRAVNSHDKLRALQDAVSRALDEMTVVGDIISQMHLPKSCHGAANTLLGIDGRLRAALDAAR